MYWKWEPNQKVDFRDLRKLYPAYPVFEWTGGDELRVLAVEMVFVVLPKELHNSTRVTELANILWETLRRWELQDAFGEKPE